jgi:lipopolysaccharide/colanic/teichoic acid biosynthesis glycosyltransferase
MDRPARSHARASDGLEGPDVVCSLAPAAGSSQYLSGKRLSPWSRSSAKRLLDCACVVPALPLLVPVLLAIALAVRLTSSGPVFFLQKRMGRRSRTFTILKFRTMIVATDKAHPAITTTDNQRFTPVGPFLRRWKLDELPQLLNVLIGHMSLVGPRPKMPEHIVTNLPCRPGVTGAATIAFAQEEMVLARVPKHLLDTYYHAVVLPAKRKLDAEYMSRATFLSDLRFIINSVLRRWDSSVMEGMLDAKALETERKTTLTLASPASMPANASIRISIPPSVQRPAPNDQFAALG